MGMKIAVPLDNQLNLYHDNPCTAPMFAIYLLEGDRSGLSFRRTTVVENPWLRVKCDAFAAEQIKCNCDPDRQKSLRHVSEHYALLDAIGGCSYLLADHYCTNTKRTLRNGGIKVFKFPAIIDQIDFAIKNFLVGASLVRSIKHINHAS